MISHAIFAPASQAAEPSVFTWSESTPGQLRLAEHGKDVFVFQLAPKSLDGKYSRANYVHPLHDPAGEVITEDFPADHPHHRGIFWAWHQVLVDGKPVCDPWVCANIEWSTPSVQATSTGRDPAGGFALLAVTRDWLVPNPAYRPDQDGGKLRGVVRETVRLTTWAARNRIRTLDFDVSLRALVEGVTIGGSDDAKGYGGFSPRIRLADDVRFISQLGEVKPQNLAVDGGAWMDVTGSFDDRKKGFAILVHPSHPGFPLKWILRAKRSMQNPQWPGREPVALPTGKDTRLRYRVILHAGQLGSRELEILWREYAGSQP